MTCKNNQIKEDEKVRVSSVTPAPQDRQIIDEARRAGAGELFREIARAKKRSGMEIWHEWSLPKP